MTLAQGLAGYAALNAAIVVAVIALILTGIVRRGGPARGMLSLHYAVCAAIAFSLTACLLLPDARLFEPAALVWSEAPQDGVPADFTMQWITVGTFGSFDAGSVGRVWIATAHALLAFGLISVRRDAVRLRAIRRRSHCVRSIGRVRVWISNVVEIPFSYWRPGRAHVVLPAWLLEQPDHFRIALAHELQHHRQRDTMWLHVFRALRLVCAANPFVHWWALRIAHLQEFACDEAVTARASFDAHRYAHCLLSVALRGAKDFNSPLGAAGLIGFGDPKVLKRRIAKMTQSKQRNPGRGHRLLLGCITTTMAAAAFAAGGWIEDQGVGSPSLMRIVNESPAPDVDASVWPVNGGQVTAGFGKHRGIDIAAEAGTPVLAFRAGLVETVDEAKGCGKRVRLRHRDVISIYCNLAGVRVTEGQNVVAGTTLAAVAPAPSGRRAHLHFELLSLQANIDPMTLLPRQAM